jgi:hypothetical protein
MSKAKDKIDESYLRFKESLEILEKRFGNKKET